MVATWYNGCSVWYVRDARCFLFLELVFYLAYFLIFSRTDHPEKLFAFVLPWRPCTPPPVPEHTQQKSHKVRAATRENSAATAIQAWIRGVPEASRSRRNQRAAVVLQALQRGVAARAGMTARHSAALRVQAVARGWKESSLFQKKRAAAVRLQAWFCATAVATGQLAQCQRAAVVVQRWWGMVTASTEVRRARYGTR